MNLSVDVSSLAVAKAPGPAPMLHTTTYHPTPEWKTTAAEKGVQNDLIVWPFDKCLFIWLTSVKVLRKFWLESMCSGVCSASLCRVGQEDQSPPAPVPIPIF